MVSCSPLHTLFDFRKDPIQGRIFFAELIQRVLKAHDPGGRVGERDLIAVQLRKFFLGPEQVRSVRTVGVCIRVAGQNKVDMVNRVHRQDFTPFAHEPLKFTSQEGESGSVNPVDTGEAFLLEEVFQGMTHLHPIGSPTGQDGCILTELDQTIDFQIDHLTLGVKVYGSTIRTQNNPMGILAGDDLRHPALLSRLFGSYTPRGSCVSIERDEYLPSAHSISRSGPRVHENALPSREALDFGF